MRAYRECARIKVSVSRTACLGLRWCRRLIGLLARHAAVAARSTCPPAQVAGTSSLSFEGTGATCKQFMAILYLQVLEYGWVPDDGAFIWMALTVCRLTYCSLPAPELAVAVRSTAPAWYLHHCSSSHQSPLGSCFWARHKPKVMGWPPAAGEDTQQLQPLPAKHCQCVSPTLRPGS